MVTVKLGYDPKEKYFWKELSKDYNLEDYNEKKVIVINKLLWDKVMNIIKLRRKGYDALIMVDGKRRTGKSTLAKTIAYLLNPNITINNYVAGLEEAPDKIDKVADEDVLIFDEGSLVASSRDIMAKKNKQLLKIIDVCGQKKLTLIFCMPSFFEISKPIAITHSIFLIHVYTDDQLNRGRFAYFGTKKKNLLYIIGKKNHGSYSRPKSDFTGMFYDFHLPFEDEYLKLKKESLREALGLKEKEKAPTESEILTKLLIKFKQNAPEIPNRVIANVCGLSLKELYRRTKGVHKPKGNDNIVIEVPQQIAH
jgi:hypothetical protein